MPLLPTACCWCLPLYACRWVRCSAIHIPLCLACVLPTPAIGRPIPACHCVGSACSPFPVTLKPLLRSYDSWLYLHACLIHYYCLPATWEGVPATATFYSHFGIAPFCRFLLPAGDTSLSYLHTCSASLGGVTIIPVVRSFPNWEDGILLILLYLHTLVEIYACPC